MNRYPRFLSQTVLPWVVCLSACASAAFAQSDSSGWRRFGDGEQPPAPAASDGTSQAAPARPAYGIPAELTVKPGTYLTVRLNDELSSNRNHAGDAFSGTLAQPLVVDGVLVAARGQSIYGRVAEASKAHGGTPSRMGLELNEIALVDGTQTPIRTQLAGFEGGRKPAGQQAGTVLTTTALGATIGAVAGRGTGAAIGAGAGALAGVVAVLLTNKKPTVLYPETVLTFRFDAPVSISTAHAAGAFRYVDPSQYDRPAQTQVRPRPASPGYGPGLGPYWGPYGRPYYGTGFSIVIGRRGWRR